MPFRTNHLVARSHALMRLKDRTVAIAAASATIIAGCLLWADSSAYADDATSGVTVQEVAAALENVSGGLVKDAAKSTGSAAEAPLQVQVPDSASDVVSMAVGDFELHISLPHAATADSAHLLGDGTTVYPSDGASSNAVVPAAGGVQLLSVIESSEAPENYSYDLTIPHGHRLEATTDGGAQIVDEQGRVKAEFEAAWAQDAAGVAVPTHYSVEGNTLTQVVNHKGMENVSYPIVADPLPVIVFVVTGLALVAVAALAGGRSMDRPQLVEHMPGEGQVPRAVDQERLHGPVREMSQPRALDARAPRPTNELGERVLVIACLFGGVSGLIATVGMLLAAVAFTTARTIVIPFIATFEGFHDSGGTNAVTVTGSWGMAGALTIALTIIASFFVLRHLGSSPAATPRPE